MMYAYIYIYDCCLFVKAAPFCKKAQPHPLRRADTFTYTCIYIYMISYILFFLYICNIFYIILYIII